MQGIDLKKPSIPLAFLLSMIALFLFPIFLPKLKLTYLAPFVTLAALLMPYPKVVRAAILSGFLLDLLTSDYRFGFYALSTYLSASFIYVQRHHLFSDKLWGFALYTSLFVLIKTLIELILVLLFIGNLNFSWRSLLSEILIMPAIDGLYALFWFTTPLFLFTLVRKQFLLWKHH